MSNKFIIGWGFMDPRKRPKRIEKKLRRRGYLRVIGNRKPCGAWRKANGSHAWKSCTSQVLEDDWDIDQSDQTAFPLGVPELDAIIAGTGVADISVISGTYG